MAKTRIKTTPTRMQKEALMASAAVTTNTSIAAENIFKKRLSVLKNASSTPAKEVLPSVQSTIIVQAPKRTNSISSATSTISYTSDGGGESTPTANLNSSTKNNGPTMAELTESAIKTLNAGLLAKSNALALKNRKVYMITEKCDDTTHAGNGNSSGLSGANGMAIGQKRKMYLIMEEKESEKNGNHNEKLIKTENTNGSKKLTLFTDTSNGQLPQKFEKILPEILNCIQAKKGAGILAAPASGVLNGKTDLEANDLYAKTIASEPNTKIKLTTATQERLPLTLPPKKNRTKIITTQIIPVNATQAIYQNHQQSQNNGIDNWSSIPCAVATEYLATNNNNNEYCKPQKSSATPVIVNASTLMTSNSNGNINGNGLKSKENSNVNANQLHKNINLSTDFLFLMKMLPKLESIEEPHKSYVKNCIEDMINEYTAAASKQNVDQ